MSKAIGQKLAIQFTEDLSGDVTGLIPKPIAAGDYIKPAGTPSGSSQYSSYAPLRVFDGDINSYWYTRTAGDQWLQIMLNDPIHVTGFRWYIGSSYRPNGFSIQGSDNGVDWVDIYTGLSDNSTGWKEFSFAVTGPYLYYRWNITSRHSSYLYVYEIELRTAAGQEKAFKLTGQQYKYINGPLLDMEYKIESVEKHPTEAKTLLLTTYIQNRFPTVEGMLKIEYDASVGSLAGRGGPVESFTKMFTPIDLAPEHNPGIEETITVAPTELEVNFIPITYDERFTEDTLTVAPAELEVNLIYVGVVNP